MSASAYGRLTQKRAGNGTGKFRYVPRGLVLFRLSFRSCLYDLVGLVNGVAPWPGQTSQKTHNQPCRNLNPMRFFLSKRTSPVVYIPFLGLAWRYWRPSTDPTLLLCHCMCKKKEDIKRLSSFFN